MSRRPVYNYDDEIDDDDVRVTELNSKVNLLKSVSNTIYYYSFIRNQIDSNFSCSFYPRI